MVGSTVAVTLSSERAADTTQLHPPRIQFSPECESWRHWGSWVGVAAGVIVDVRLVRGTDGYAPLLVVVGAPFLVAVPLVGAFVGAGVGEGVCRAVTHE